MIGNYLPLRLGNKNVWHFMAERLRQAGWNVITTSSQENKMLRLADMLNTIIRRRNDYDLAQIDVFSGPAFLFASLSAKLLKRIGKPFILTMHGGGLPEMYAKHPRPLTRLLQNASEVVTPSPLLQIAFHPVRTDIRLIPNPIDIPSARYRLRKTVTPRLIWVRAFHTIYNPQMAIRVLSELRDQGVDASLFMVGPDKGDGNHADTVALAKTLKVQNHIQWVGGVPHEQIPEWLDKADIFLNTTNYDTSPRSLLEAMANGLCVISTNVGGVPYLVTDQVDGLLVPKNDHTQMTTAIVSLLENPDLASRLSENARQKVLNQDWHQVLPQWTELFLEVSRKYEQV